MRVRRYTKSRRGASAVAVERAGGTVDSLLNTTVVERAEVNEVMAAAQAGSDEPTAGDGAFLGLADGTVMKVDPDTGAQAWHAPITGGRSEASPLPRGRTSSRRTTRTWSTGSIRRAAPCGRASSPATTSCS